MVDTTDIQGYENKFRNQLAKVDEADIPDADREAIHAYVRHMDANRDVNKGTMVSHINRLRLSAERSAVALTAMGVDDVNQLVFDLKHDHGLSEGTLRNYRKALRKFFEFRGEGWWEDIKVGPSPDRQVDPNQLLSEAEIQALIDAAPNPREKALIAMLADSGLRIGALGSLRVRDVDFSGPTATVTINENANVKGASGTIPLTWSEGYLGNWLDNHPRRDDPDAALIHKLNQIGGDDGALDYHYLSRRVKEAADGADIERDRVNTHNFRKSAISRWIREGMPEQAIKHRATWDVDTDMFETYSGVRDEELNDQILAHYDLDEDAEAVTHTVENCPRCRTSLLGSESFCPSCGAPLSQVAAEEVDAAEDAVTEDGFETRDMGDRDLSRAFRRALKSDAELREAILSELE